MYTWIGGALLLLLTLVARADDRSDQEDHFAFRGDSSLLAGFSGAGASPVAAAPDASFYGGSEDSLRIMEAQREQLATYRDQIYNALGISRLIPRGNFLAGPLHAEWRLAAPNRNTVELRLEARW